MKVTRKVKIITALGTLFLIGVALVWICGHLPFTQRSQVRHALGVSCLPYSVTINKAGGESWTDYSFYADISINPDDIDYILQGREFEESKYLGKIPKSYLENYEPFEHNSRYEWGDWSDIGAICNLYIHRSEGRVFIEFGAD